MTNEKTKPLKVCFLHLANSPQTFYRMVQFADEMRNMDHISASYPEFKPDKYDFQLREYELNVEQNLKMVTEIFKNNDIVVAQSVHSLEFLCTLKALSYIYLTTLILEIDDNPFEIDSSHFSYEYIGMGSEMEKDVYDQIKSSCAIITSTDYLKDTLLKYNGNVYTVPNCLDFDLWESLQMPPKSDKIVIGWSGGNGHQKDLKLIKEVFEELLKNNDNVIVKCLHGAKDLIKHDRFINETTWTEIGKYPQVYANMGFDIGVAPLVDSEFNRCKSNLRYLELSALKIPTVASDVEPYANSITDGVDGFIAKNKKEFLDKIQKLVYNKELREKIGYSAYQNVKKNYNLKTVTQKYADILREIYDNIKVSKYVNIYPTSK